MIVCGDLEQTLAVQLELIRFARMTRCLRPLVHLPADRHGPEPGTSDDSAGVFPIQRTIWFHVVSVQMPWK